MRASAVIALTALTLTACGERSETAAPAAKAAPEAKAAAAVAPAAPVVLTAAELRRVCRAGLAAIHGQTLSAISIDGLEGPVVNASWRAPVDGGRMRAQCRVDGDVVTWKAVDRPTPEENRWMNQSGDPVVRFVLDGDAITINTTLPDGATATEQYSVSAEQEAR
ncbi:hypothetical protein [Brevundimonas sp. Root1279]|uniref:hypothetical protein n=1 Tax=Brevundimonas sp. Root1279 TaxID=1736443 RepID=UPI0006F5AD34|nr:hypothetical protein [Brevundimonas sp. Root1279]KQW83650.1 hypothetical protein ASC65_03065 [Brevundimonas sp. Root1279]